MRLRARARVENGGYEGLRGATRGYEGLRECSMSLCASGGGVGAWGALAAASAAVALRARHIPPPGPVVPVWRLRSARATANVPGAPRSLRGCWARCGARVTWVTMGARCGAQPPSSYIYLSSYLLTADQRGDGLHLPTATHSGAREAQLCARAVGYQAYHRADRPSRALRAAHAGTAAWYECACLWLGI